MTRAPAHTPGPWTVESDGNGLPIITAEGLYVVAHVRTVVGLNGEMLGNAALIAAAPDLLALARDLAELYLDTDAPFGLRAQKLVARIDGGGR